jgi:hypothetical protein
MIALVILPSLTSAQLRDPQRCAQCLDSCMNRRMQCNINRCAESGGYQKNSLCSGFLDQQSRRRFDELLVDCEDDHASCNKRCRDRGSCQPVM